MVHTYSVLDINCVIISNNKVSLYTAPKSKVTRRLCVCMYVNKPAYTESLRLVQGPSRESLYLLEVL